MTSENLDKKLESVKFALDAKFKKLQEEERLEYERKQSEEIKQKEELRIQHNHNGNKTVAYVLGISMAAATIWLISNGIVNNIKNDNAKITYQSDTSKVNKNSVITPTVGLSGYNKIDRLKTLDNSIGNDLKRPEIGHAYQIWDITHYCRGRVGNSNPEAFDFIIGENNGVPIHETLTTSRFDYYYSQDGVIELGKYNVILPLFNRYYQRKIQKIVNEKKENNLQGRVETDKGSYNSDNRNLLPSGDNNKSNTNEPLPIFYRPQIGNLYVINDSALYCDNKFQRLTSDSVYMFLLNKNNIHTEYYYFTTNRFNDLYKQGMVKDLGYRNKDDIIKIIKNRRDSTIFQQLQPKTRLGRFWQKYQKIQHGH